MSVSSLPVLIVGAGPAGLVLAVSLLRHNVPFRIIEKSSTVHVGTRGAGVMPRSLELLQILGLLPELRKQRGPSAPPMSFYKLPGGTEVLSTSVILEKAESTPAQPFNDAWFISQSVFEAVLRAELQKGGYAVEFGSELIKFQQDEYGVVADIMRTGVGFEQIDASFLVGTDGAKGVVRKILGSNFLGKTMDSEGFIVANAVVPNLSTDVWHIWRDPQSLAFFFRPFDPEQKKFVITITGHSDDLEDYGSPEGIRALMASHIGRDDIVFGDFEWVSYFRANMRVVDKFSEGRVFLAGDAAHVHPPYGAQGLNSSIQDSINLSWKIALVYRGFAPESLLETYNQERLPVIAEMLKQVTGIIDKETKTEPQSGSSMRGKELFMLDINYRWSPIILDHRSQSSVGMRELKAHAYIGWADLCAGDRAPSLSGLAAPDWQEATLFDVLSPSMHSVLFFDTSEPNEAESLLQAVDEYFPSGTAQTVLISQQPEATAMPVDHQLILYDDQPRETYFVTNGQLTVIIVRPDGYIGGIVHDIAGLLQYLSLIFM